VGRGKSKIMKHAKEIGILHSATQVLALGIFTGGGVFLLPLALAEITGWVMLGLWIGLNFLCLPTIVFLLDRLIIKITKPLVIGKNILTGLIGGVLAFCISLAYMKFHTYYIRKDFIVQDYFNDFIPIATVTGSTIMITEIFRNIRRMILASRQVKTNSPSGNLPI
jgi:hypothetical protein